jgi:hypothetical protein
MFSYPATSQSSRFDIIVKPGNKGVGLTLHSMVLRHWCLFFMVFFFRLFFLATDLEKQPCSAPRPNYWAAVYLIQHLREMPIFWFCLIYWNWYNLWCIFYFLYYLTLALLPQVSLFLVWQQRRVEAEGQTSPSWGRSTTSVRFTEVFCFYCSLGLIISDVLGLRRECALKEMTGVFCTGLLFQNRKHCEIVEALFFFFLQFKWKFLNHFFTRTPALG